MNGKQLIPGILQLIIAFVVIALVLGQFLGYPILFGYVETGSMQPTLAPGDGFIAIPALIVDDPSVNDVVVFEAEELHGGGLTTHRIVAETDRGYVTQGDDNPGTDQEGNEPYVQDAQIRAVAFQIDTTVVVIPQLGTVVEGIGGTIETGQNWLASTLGVSALLGTQGIAVLLLGLTIFAYIGDLFLTRRYRTSHRQRTVPQLQESHVDEYLILTGVILLLCAVATAAMVVPGGPVEFGVLSADFESERPLVIERGTTDPVTHPLTNAGLVPVHVYLEPDSDAVSVDHSHVYLGPAEHENTTVTITAPDETGYFPMYITEYRYLGLLPAPVIHTLYSAHPLLPILVLNLTIGTAVFIIGFIGLRWNRLMGNSRNRMRSPHQ